MHPWTIMCVDLWRALHIWHLPCWIAYKITMMSFMNLQLQVVHTQQSSCHNLFPLPNLFSKKFKEIYPIDFVKLNWWELPSLFLVFLKAIILIRCHLNAIFIYFDRITFLRKWDATYMRIIIFTIHISMDAWTWMCGHYIGFIGYICMCLVQWFNNC